SALLQVCARQQPPMALPGKAFAPGFAIAALVARGAPNAIGPGSIFRVQPDPANCDPTRASPAHPGGMVVAMADGSVRNLAPEMSGDVWWSAVTLDGGEAQ